MVNPANASCSSNWKIAVGGTNLLDEEGATEDLRALVRFDPAWEVPAGYSVSRLLADLLAGVRDAETALERILPPDITDRELSALDEFASHAAAAAAPPAARPGARG